MTEPTQEKFVYNPKELEPLLQLSKNTINALLRSGRLRSVRVGRRYLIPREAVQQFLAGVAQS